MKTHQTIQQIGDNQTLTISDGYLSLNLGELDIAAGDGEAINLYNRVVVNGTNKDLTIHEGMISVTGDTLSIPNTLQVPDGNFILNVFDTSTITLQAQGGLTIDTNTGALLLNADSGTGTFTCSGTMNLESTGSTQTITSNGDQTLTSGGATYINSDNSVIVTPGASSSFTLNSGTGVSLDTTSGDVELTAGGNVVLNPTGEIRLDSTVDTSSGNMTIQANGGAGNITLYAANILFNGELDTASGNMTIKANNGSGNVNITSLVGTSTSGHGVTATGDTTSPTTSALTITPQDTAPSSGALGDIYVHSTSGLMSSYYDTGVWGRHGEILYAISSRVTHSLAADDTDDVITYTFPANRIRVGTTIKLYVAGEHDSCLGLPAPRITLDGDAGTWLLQGTNSDTNRHIIEATITCRSIGATGSFFCSVMNDAFNYTTYNRRFYLDTYTVDTTGSWVLSLQYGDGEGGSELGVDQFILEIYD